MALKEEFKAYRELIDLPKLRLLNLRLSPEVLRNVQFCLSDEIKMRFPKKNFSKIVVVQAKFEKFLIYPLQTFGTAENGLPVQCHC